MLRGHTGLGVERSNSVVLRGQPGLPLSVERSNRVKC